ncbi:hypothetical protein IJ118_02940 [Candidatus Saccharibacteria bacterium]|nr:hypothetical protein [Candidatus Saccharibacteria bacterium]
MKRGYNKIVRIIIICGCVAVLVSIVGFIVNFILSRPRYFTNLDEVHSSINSGQWRDIEDLLISYNSQTNPDDGNVDKIIVASNSYSESSSGGTLVASFAVNLDAVERSYMVYYTRPADTSEPAQITINCPRYIYNKYPETHCVGMNNSSESIDLYLPQEFTLKNGQTVRMESGYKNGISAVVINFKNCGNLDLIQTATTRAKEVVLSFGLNPDMYYFDVPLNYKSCLIK